MRPKAIEWPALAKHAYDAYCRRMGEDPSNPRPHFLQLQPKTRDAWVMAAKAVAERV